MCTDGEEHMCDNGMTGTYDGKVIPSKTNLGENERKEKLKLFSRSSMATLKLTKVGPMTYDL